MRRLTRIARFQALLLGLGVGAFSSIAYAVDGNPPNLFELDGDPHEILAGPPPDDWETLYFGGGSAIEFTGILADPAPVTIYWKGGSKDINDITEWWHKDGSVPDKDDITNAFAAAYVVEDDVCYSPLGYDPECDDVDTEVVHMEDDLIIYFGLDRYDNSGDAFAGFWFLQDDVTLLGSQFDGEHVAKTATTPGDLLALVEYPQGAGASPEIKVYEWDPADADGDGNLDEDGGSIHPLDLIIDVEDALCDGLGNKLACAISNIASIPTPPWDYTPKGGMLNDPYPLETFYEGGINVTALLGGVTPCISTFLAETRSSRSESAQLKDFVLDSFSLCGIDADKECDADLNEAGDQVTVSFSGTVTNSGAIAVDISLTDSETGSVFTAVCHDDNGTPGECDGGDSLPVSLAGIGTGNPTFMLAPGDTVLYEGNYVVNAPISSLDFSDTVTAVASVDSEEVDSTTAEAECSTTGTPDIMVSKDCTPSFLGGDTFQAYITGGAENTGNVKLVNVSLSDTVFSSGDLTVVTDSNGNGLVDGGEPAFDGDLEPGEKLAFNATFSSTSTTSHANTMTVEGDNVFDESETVSDSDDASCSITPNPDLSITKVCDDSINGTGVRLTQTGGIVAVEVGNVITVTNSGDEDLNPVQVSDSETDLSTAEAGWSCAAGVCTGSLDVGESIIFTQTYMPDGFNIIGALTDPGSVYFSNTATASGAGVLSGTPVGPVEDYDDCKLCPPCPECAPE